MVLPLWPRGPLALLGAVHGESQDSPPPFCRRWGTTTTEKGPGRVLQDTGASVPFGVPWGLCRASIPTALSVCSYRPLWVLGQSKAAPTGSGHSACWADEKECLSWGTRGLQWLSGPNGGLAYLLPQGCLFTVAPTPWPRGSPGWPLPTGGKCPPAIQQLGGHSRVQALAGQGAGPCPGVTPLAAAPVWVTPSPSRPCGLFSPPPLGCQWTLMVGARLILVAWLTLIFLPAFTFYLPLSVSLEDFWAQRRSPAA